VSNFPCGVTGNEYEIAGPDYEKESDIICPECGGHTMFAGYREQHWLACQCGWTVDRERPSPDPDRVYDEMRDRQMLGIDVPDGMEE
jgi:hypothetical protein